MPKRYVLIAIEEDGRERKLDLSVEEFDQIMAGMDWGTHNASGAPWDDVESKLYIFSNEEETTA
jgi:hypothetical protein